VTEAMDSPLHGIASDGPRDVIVHETDLEAAREVLANAKQQ
jgi:hypothetical protein